MLPLGKKNGPDSQGKMVLSLCWYSFKEHSHYPFNLPLPSQLKWLRVFILCFLVSFNLNKGFGPQICKTIGLIND